MVTVVVNRVFNLMEVVYMLITFFNNIYHFSASINKIVTDKKRKEVKGKFLLYLVWG